MDQNPLLSRRRNIVIYIYILAGVCGFRFTVNPEPIETVIYSFGIAILMTWFCITDSQVRGKPLPWTLQWIIFLTWPAFVLIYLIATRGFKRVHWILFVVVSYFLTPWFAYLIANALLTAQFGTP